MSRTYSPPDDLLYVSCTITIYLDIKSLIIIFIGDFYAKGDAETEKKLTTEAKMLEDTRNINNTMRNIRAADEM